MRLLHKDVSSFWSATYWLAVTSFMDKIQHIVKQFWRLVAVSCSFKVGRHIKQRRYDTFNCLLPAAARRFVGNAGGKLLHHLWLVDTDSDLVEVHRRLSGKLHHSFCHCIRYVSRRHANLTYKPCKIRDEPNSVTLFLSTLTNSITGEYYYCIRITDARKIDALDQWCLRMLLGITWYQFVRNDDIRRLTKQPKLTAIIQLRRLTLFGHIMCIDDNANANRILLASPPANWRRQLGRPGITWLSTVQQDLKQRHLTLPKAADLAQNRPLWRMMSTYGATQS